MRSYSNVTQQTLSLEKLPDFPQLQVGDIVLRFGVGLDSYVIASSSDSHYSHSGIISSIAPEIMITHATTADDLGANFNGVVNVPLARFLEQSTAIAVIRYPSLSQEHYPQLQSFLKQQEGRDFSFDQSDPQGIYCTTLIEQALEPLIFLQLTRLHMDNPLAKGDYLFPEAFLHDPNAVMIYAFPSHTASSELVEQESLP